MIDAIIALRRRPGYRKESDDPAHLRAMLGEHIRRGWYVALFDPAGALQGFMAWIRTDEFGAACIRAWGLDQIVFLAIPIPMAGPVVVITFDVIAPGADRLTISRLYGQVQARNPDGAVVCTWLSGRRGDKWMRRRLHSRREFHVAD